MACDVSPVTMFLLYVVLTKDLSSLYVVIFVVLYAEPTKDLGSFYPRLLSNPPSEDKCIKTSQGDQIRSNYPGER